MAGKSSNKIENLNNQNYQTWKFTMELLLIKEDLWETVTKEIPDPVTAEWQTKDAKARAIIGLQVADNQLHLIRKQKTAKGSWQTLKKYHEKATLTSKVNLLKRLCGLKLTEHGDMENHLAEMQNASRLKRLLLVSKDVTFLERDPHSSKETQCDGDLFEDQLSEADEENATSTLIENHPEREITDQNLEITAPEENTRRSERSTKGKPPERLVEVMNKATTLER